MILQALKKSTASPTLLRIGKISNGAHGTMHHSRSHRHLSINQHVKAIGGTRSFVALPAHRKPYGTNDIAAVTTVRFPPGNPSTMAFLGLRSKSSGAAFRAQYDDELETAMNGTRGEEERSVRESWMVNLGRSGDEEWLTGPRGGDWFTGVAPDVCPGECVVS